MAEGPPPSPPPPPVEAAGRRPALDFEGGYGARGFYVRIRIDSPYLAAGIVGAGVATLGAFHLANPEGVETAVRNALAGLADRVLVRPGSVLVDLVCYTKERFLAFKDAFEANILRQRIQEEFYKTGFKGELEVTIVKEREVYDNVSRIREEMEELDSEIGESFWIGSIGSDRHVGATAPSPTLESHTA